MSRKFLTPKDEYAVSRTVKAHALRIYNRGYLEIVKEQCRKQDVLLRIKL